MKRRHAMPFGTEILPNGAARFRLWAPAAANVQLELKSRRGFFNIPMQAESDGWHGIAIDSVDRETRYAFRVDGGNPVPDPASRFNPDDVHSASALVDPQAFEWEDENWQGRPWREAVVYELHVGTFTPAGTFNAAQERLDYLAHIGVTAIELMPIADFPGQRNWGYDGVLPFAPDASYGTPDDLKMLIAAAHARGLMMLLDVVYNHFGPEGNYLHRYAPQFFSEEHQTPWGAALNFDGPQARTVRDFFIHNALYWLEEYNFDGLRLDAVHAMIDDTQPDIVTELAQAVRSGPGRDRHVHIVLENDRNQARYLKRDPGGLPLVADAQWNDDFHHAAHVLITGERDGYYIDYAQRPAWLLGRALAEGFAFQGDSSVYRDAPRGESSRELPLSAFIAFMQTHDQVGNRAFGERIATLGPSAVVRLGAVCLLLAPSVPMLFMGEEFGACTPFLFFCDFDADLAAAVRDGRRREFNKFSRFGDPHSELRIPDPGAEATFSASKLNWNEADRDANRECQKFYRELLQLRHRWIVPHLENQPAPAQFAVVSEKGIAVDWQLGTNRHLHLRANFSATPCTGFPAAPGAVVYNSAAESFTGTLSPWSAVWTLEAPC